MHKYFWEMLWLAWAQMAVLVILYFQPWKLPASKWMGALWKGILYILIMLAAILAPMLILAGLSAVFD